MSEVLSLKLQHAGKSTSEITEFARGKFKVSKAIQNRAFQLPKVRGKNARRRDIRLPRGLLKTLW
jgi:hypothetical protein